MALERIISLCERCFRPSETPATTPVVFTAELLGHHLELAKEFLRQSEAIMADSREGLMQIIEPGRRLRKQVQSNQVLLNSRQCEYLVEKLRIAIKSAMEFMSMSTPDKKLESMRNWNFLVQLAMDVTSFVQECSKVEWTQAAKMLIDVFEHVASLDSHLDLCIWGFKNRDRILLGTALRREFINMSENQDRRLRGHDYLLKKVEAALSLESISNLQVIQHATSILEELEGGMGNNPTPNNLDLLVLASFHDQVDLLHRVEAALSSECVSNLEEHQLADSVAERFRAAVANPVSDKAHLDFMRVNSESLKREKPLGTGACGEVYKVEWLGIPAAEKTLSGLENEASLFQALFDQEVTILARLSHPRIVRLLCYVKEGVRCSMVLELMDKDLFTLIRESMHLDENSESARGFPFCTDAAVDIMLQISEGMDYLHRRRVLHRGLKSQNILVKCQKLGKVEFVDVKVADFGISKTKERSITLSHPTWNTGTARWMAPELIQGRFVGNNDNNKDSSEKYPFRSDVYSFGMVCYEILTGGVPFADISLSNDVKRKLILGERPDLPSHCPPCLASMIKKCWRIEPQERPTFAEISRELRFMKGSLLIGRDL